MNLNIDCLNKVHPFVFVIARWNADRF